MMRSTRDLTGFFKVQVYDAISLTWRDASGRHPTQEAAHAALPEGVRSRVVEVAVRDRRRVDVLPQH